MDRREYWNSKMVLPSYSETAIHNASAVERSPYVYGWMRTPVKAFYEYSVCFKADYLPPATYCCLANFDLDYSALLETYESYRLEYNGVAAYAGLQTQLDGRTNAIMSCWDIFCRDRSGRETVIRPKVVRPAGKGAAFSGEGTGCQCLVDYSWQAGRWYEMRISIGRSGTTGNSTLEQWVCDLSAAEWTFLCKYDLGVRGVCFKGDMCVFLENFYQEVGGDVRTMEVKEMYVCDQYGDRHKLKSGLFAYNKYPGSYRFGVDGDTFYMITTGCSGKAPAQENCRLSIP